MSHAVHSRLCKRSSAKVRSFLRHKFVLIRSCSKPTWCLQLLEEESAAVRKSKKPKRKKKGGSDAAPPDRSGVAQPSSTQPIPSEKTELPFQSTPSVASQDRPVDPLSQPLPLEETELSPTGVYPYVEKPEDNSPNQNLLESTSEKPGQESSAGPSTSSGDALRAKSGTEAEVRVAQTEEESKEGRDRGEMNSSGDVDRAEELQENETDGEKSSADGLPVGGKDVAEEAPRLGEGAAEVGDDMEKSTEGQEAESESVEYSVLEDQTRLDPLNTTFAEGGEKAVVVEGRCEVRVHFLFAKRCLARLYHQSCSLAK